MRRNQQWQYLTVLSRQRFDEQSSKLFDTGLTKYDEQQLWLDTKSHSFEN